MDKFAINRDGMKMYSTVIVWFLIYLLQHIF